MQICLILTFTNSYRIDRSLSQNPAQFTQIVPQDQMHLLKSTNLQHSPPLTLMHCLNSLHFTPISHQRRDLLILSPSGASQILPSPCPTAAWDQQWRHCETGGSGLTQPVCCPGLAWPLPETSPPSPAGTPHPPGAVAGTATASKHPTFVSRGQKRMLWCLTTISFLFFLF